VSVNSDGIPTIIPHSFREAFKLPVRDYRVIRLVLTILGLYRVIEVASVAKIGTITDPFAGLSTVLDVTMLTTAISRLFLGERLLMRKV